MTADRFARALLALLLAVATVYDWLHRPRAQRAIAWAVRAWIIVGWLLLIPLAVYLHGGAAA